MLEKSRAWRHYILALLAIAILIQYEVREYQRYTPATYWPLKFVVQYGLAAVLAWIATSGTIRSLLKRQTATRPIPLLILAVGFPVIWAIRSQTTLIAYEAIVLRDGLYCDATTGKALDGTYKTPSRWDGFGAGDNCLKEQFDNGVPTGKWMDSHKGEFVQAGRYLNEPALQNRLAQQTGSKRVDLNLFQEGEAGAPDLLTVALIEPATADSTTLAKAIDLTIQILKPKYVLSGLFVNKRTNGEDKELKRLLLN